MQLKNTKYAKKCYIEINPISSESNTFRVSAIFYSNTALAQANEIFVRHLTNLKYLHHMAILILICFFHYQHSSFNCVKSYSVESEGKIMMNDE